MKVEDISQSILEVTVELLIAGECSCESVDLVDRELLDERRDAVHRIAPEEIEAPSQTGQRFPKRRDCFPKEPFVPGSTFVCGQHEDSGHLARRHRGPERRLIVHPQVGPAEPYETSSHRPLLEDLEYNSKNRSGQMMDRQLT